MIMSQCQGLAQASVTGQWQGYFGISVNTIERRCYARARWISHGRPRWYAASAERLPESADCDSYSTRGSIPPPLSLPLLPHSCSDFWIAESQSVLRENFKFYRRELYGNQTSSGSTVHDRTKRYDWKSFYAVCCRLSRLGNYRDN